MMRVQKETEILNSAPNSTDSALLSHLVFHYTDISHVIRYPV
jgi:hypothetical protein